MSKKMKLNLSDLNVQSFVTSLGKKEKNAVRGAIMSADDANDACYSYDWGCVGSPPGGTYVSIGDCVTGGQCTVYTVYTCQC